MQGIINRLVSWFRRRFPRRTPPPPFTKSAENPIIAPESRNGWEAWQTFNPGAIFLGDKVHFLYRAIGGDGMSRFGYAASRDGLTVDERLPYPVYEHRMTGRAWSVFSFASGGSWGGSEDPRIVRIGDEDVLYVTYTACDGGLRMGLTSIGIDDFLHRRWRWRRPVLLSPPGQVHKNWVLFPEKIRGKYALLHSINPHVSIHYLDTLEFPCDACLTSTYQRAFRGSSWDSWIRGVGAPPIKTPRGWLLFYHAIDERDPGKYKVGALLLDLEDPERILYRAEQPVLEPNERYENDGFKPGIVYVSGAVVKDDTLLIYYGGADSYVCVASAPLDAFLDELVRASKPSLKRRMMTLVKR